MAEVRSISMPPNFSGRITPVRPSCPDLRWMEMASPGSWCWIASTLGPTSLFQNSSVVRAMARCSSVKSSGEKISSGVDAARRHEPPWCLVGERVEDAINSFSFLVSGYSLVHVFENSGGALATADTHRYHSVARAAALHLAQDGCG